MNSDYFREETWRKLLTSYDPALNDDGMPLGILLGLYPEVQSFGPVAELLRNSAARMHNFLKGVAEVVDSPYFEGADELRNFEFFSFLSLGAEDFGLTDLEKHWWFLDGATKETEFPNTLNAKIHVWSKMSSLDKAEGTWVELSLGYYFYSTALQMLTCLLSAAFHQVMVGIPNYDGLYKGSERANEIFCAFRYNDLEARLEDFRAAAKKAGVLV